MSLKFKNFMLLVFTATAVILTSNASFSAPDEDEVLKAMKKATDYMMNTVSYRGGFVWKYSEDLSQQWGEIPARRTQIWVQGATNGVGDMLIDAYKATGDGEFLEYTKRTAKALIWGQHPAGGWHYLIDFDMPGIRKWYDEVASKCWGWEEYYHYYGNCTYDDDTTASSVRFLLKLYMTTLDPAYRLPLIKALDFVLESQFPNGAWPQRYPLKKEFVKQGIADYSSYYTYNDRVMWNNITTLLDAWEELGNEEYRKAAERGMDFYIVSQIAEPQAGWCEQYSHDMMPAQARTYEPAGVDSRQTMYNIRDLETFYKITGDRRYLEPIPAAIKWYENSVINTDTSKGYTHARMYEIGTNKPIYTYRIGTNIDNGGYYQTYTLGKNGATGVMPVDIAALKKEYERVNALTPEAARAEYDKSRSAEKIPRVKPEEIEEIIKSMNVSGAWIEDVVIRNYDNPQLPIRNIRGIETSTYINNMKKMIYYLKNLKQKD